MREPVERTLLRRLLGKLPGELKPVLRSFRSSRSADEYDWALARVRRETARQAAALNAESSEAHRQLGPLEDMPPERRRLAVLNQPRLMTFSLAAGLLRLSWDRRSVDPVDAESLAQLALEVLEQIPAHPVPTLLEDLRARAWGQIGNTRRIRSDLRGADEAFRHAAEHLARGSHDLLEQALISHWLGSLRRDQRRFEEAVDHLVRACRLYRQIRDDESRAQALINLGYTYREAGEPTRGLPVLRQAEALLPEQHPLLLYVRHNQIYFLIDLGRYVEAERLLAKTRPLYAHSPEALTRLRLPWVEGRLAKHTGRLEEAEYLFQKVRQGFVRHGIGYDAALVSLELAEIYACQGRTDELKRLAGEMVTVFRSRNVERETLAALLMLQHAASAEQATLHVIRDIAAKLRRRAPGTPPLRSEES